MIDFTDRRLWNFIQSDQFYMIDVLENQWLSVTTSVTGPQQLLPSSGQSMYYTFC